MSPPDLKALGVKMGEWVTLRRMDETTQLLRAWPSKGNLQHNVTLHRVWQPFLEEASDSIDDSKAATSPRYVTRSASRAAAARSSPGGVNRKVSITAGPALVLSIPCSSIRYVAPLFLSFFLSFFLSYPLKSTPSPIVCRTPDLALTSRHLFPGQNRSWVGPAPSTGADGALPTVRSRPLTGSASPEPRCPARDPLARRSGDCVDHPSMS